MEITVDKESAKLLVETFKDVAMDDLVSGVASVLNQKQPNLEKWVSLPKLATMIGLSRDDINGYISQGLPHTMSGSQPRFKPSEVSKWIDNHQAKGWGSYE